VAYEVCKPAGDGDKYRIELIIKGHASHFRRKLQDHAHYLRANRKKIRINLKYNWKKSIRFGVRLDRPGSNRAGDVGQSRHFKS
jgi:hypothetical protein